MRLRPAFPSTLVIAASLLTAAAALPVRAPAQIVVSTEWLAQHLRDPGVVVIHAAGQKSDYDAGHIPGARWLAWQSYTTQRDGLSTELPDAAQLDSVLELIGVSDRAHVIIAGGPVTTTARLYFTLDYFGLGDRLSLLDGGIDSWREEGRPVERTSSSVARGAVTLRPQLAKLVDAKSIMTLPAASHVRVLDARVPEFFAGLAANNTRRAGRLPIAQNVPFTWLTSELTRFRDRAKLERLFAQARVQKGDTVVTYCHIGMQASVLYVAAKLLGFEAAVYDGSFEDWSRRSELPVAPAASTARPPDR